MKFSKKELLPIFSELAQSSYKGVFGVMKIDHGIPGPTVCISVCTHGNEPSGLFGVQKLLQFIQDNQITLRGTLLLIVNNIKATEAYLNAKQGIATHNFRYVDSNMNRLPVDVFTKSTNSYEELRAQELRPVWEEINFALDVHSTTLPTVPFIVNPKPKLEKELIAGLPVYKVIFNVDAHASGFPAIHFYGNSNKPAHTLGIECGSHEDQDGFDIAYKSMVTFIRHAGCIESEAVDTHREYEVYEIYKSVYMPNSSYRVTKEFGNFEKLSAGAELMVGDGPPVVLEKDSCSFFVSPGINFGPAEEVMFLSKPAKKIHL